MADGESAGVSLPQEHRRPLDTVETLHVLCPLLRSRVALCFYLFPHTDCRSAFGPLAFYQPLSPLGKTLSPSLSVAHEKEQRQLLCPQTVQMLRFFFFVLFPCVRSSTPVPLLVFGGP